LDFLSVSTEKHAKDHPLAPYLEKFEKIITRFLIVMMAFVVLLSTVELAWLLGKDVLSPPLFLLDLAELLELFGQFLLVLIGLELLHTMKIFIVQRVVHLEAVIVVALIAISRKIITLEPKELPDGTLLGIAVLVLALAVAYYLVRRSHSEHPDPYTEAKK
jgi:uncharacterized membrane protein (DUF373 family)